MTRDTDGSWAEAQAHVLAQRMSEALRDWIVSDTPTRPVYGAARVGELCLAWLRREFGDQRAE